MSDRIGAAADRIRRWRSDPAGMVREEFGVEPDKWQAKALHLFAHGKQRLAMKACKGPGKTTVLAWMILNFLACYGEKGEHPKGAAVSITAANINANLWPEIAKWRARSPFFMAAFEWTQTRIFAKQHPQTWFFEKRAWPKTANATEQAGTLAGLHAKYVLFVLDESGAIPQAVMATAEGALSTIGGWKKIVQAGNPTDLSGPLYRACNEERALWDVIEITGDPDDPNRSPRIDVAWAREQIDKYGAENPWVLVNVFGKFPPSSVNTLLGPDEVSEAMRRHLADHVYGGMQKRIGIDVARFGDDKTVLFPRQGLRAFNPKDMRNARTDAIAARIATAKAKFGSEMELIDSTGGYSAGVEDQCRHAGIHLLPINFSSAALDPRYFNRRSEMYFKAAEWVKNGGWLPDFPQLVPEATAATYWFEKGKLRVSEKDQVKIALNGQSPDYWDAFMLTFALPDMPMDARAVLNAAGIMMPGSSGMAHEWNPYDEKRLGALV